ncbi:MAG: type VI secretion system tip protein TssI/VgrG [Pseudomonadota bacterium]
MNSQENRSLRIDNSFNCKNFLFLIHIEGTEKISQLFEYQLTIITDTELTPKSVLGESVNFYIYTKDGDDKWVLTRSFNGIVSMLKRGQAVNYKSDNYQTSLHQYHLSIVPKLWCLTKSQHCRVFRKKGQTVIDIAELLLDYYQIDYDTSQVSNPLSWERCTQYNETDFAFLIRILNASGIFFYFKHDQQKHTLVLSNTTSGYMQQNSVLYHKNNKGYSPYIYDYEWTGKLMTENYCTTDIDIEQPDNTLYAKQPFDNQQDNIKTMPASLCFAYPSFSKTTQDSKQQATLLSAQTQSNAYKADFKSNYTDLQCAQTIVLSDEYFANEIITNCAIVKFSFEAKDTSGFTLEHNENKTDYRNSFTCVPNTIVYCPQNSRNQVTFPNIQLAMVVNSEGKTTGSQPIYNDDYGRVCIKFFWENYPDNPLEKTNHFDQCDVQITNHFGDGLFRVGTMVIVTFPNNNMDCPIILGAANNANQLPLGKFDAGNAMQTIMQQFPGADDNQQYNNITFNDKKDQQAFQYYAAKDMAITIENDRNAVLKSGDDSLLLEKGDLLIEVQKGRYILKVKGDIAIQSDGDISLNAKGSMSLHGNQVHISSESAMTHEAGTSYAISAGTTASMVSKIQSTFSSSGSLEIKSPLINLGNQTQPGQTTLTNAMQPGQEIENKINDQIEGQMEGQTDFSEQDMEEEDPTTLSDYIIDSGFTLDTTNYSLNTDYTDEGMNREIETAITGAAVSDTFDGLGSATDNLNSELNTNSVENMGTNISSGFDNNFQNLDATPTSIEEDIPTLNTDNPIASITPNIQSSVPTITVAPPINSVVSSLGKLGKQTKTDNAASSKNSTTAAKTSNTQSATPPSNSVPTVHKANLGHAGQQTKVGNSAPSAGSTTTPASPKAQNTIPTSSGASTMTNTSSNLGTAGNSPPTSNPVSSSSGIKVPPISANAQRATSTFNGVSAMHNTASNLGSNLEKQVKTGNPVSSAVSTTAPVTAKAQSTIPTGNITSVMNNANSNLGTTGQAPNTNMPASSAANITTPIKSKLQSNITGNGTSGINSTNSNLASIGQQPQVGKSNLTNLSQPLTAGSALLGTAGAVASIASTARGATPKLDNNIEEHQTTYKNGNIKERFFLKDEQLHGLHQSFNEQGIPLNSSSFVDGKLDGFAYTYDNQGQLLQRRCYKNDQLNGRMVCYQNGSIQMLTRYKNGLEDGTRIMFNDKRQLMTKQCYAKGELHGLNLLYYPDGTVMQTANYVSGKLHGEVIDYDPSGNIRDQQYYDHGKPCKQPLKKEDINNASCCENE